MYLIPEQLVAANQAAVAALLTIANTALASAERLAALNLNTARSVLEDGVDGAKRLLEAKDAQQVVSLQSSITQPGLDQAVSYARSLFEISAQTQDVMVQMIDIQVGEFRAQVSALLAQASKQAPAGSEVAVAVVRSAFASANSAFDNLSQGAKQLSALTESNVNTATTAVGKQTA